MPPFVRCRDNGLRPRGCLFWPQDITAEDHAPRSVTEVGIVSQLESDGYPLFALQQVRRDLIFPVEEFIWLFPPKFFCCQLPSVDKDGHISPSIGAPVAADQNLRLIDQGPEVILKPSVVEEKPVQFAGAVPVFSGSLALKVMIAFGFIEELKSVN